MKKIISLVMLTVVFVTTAIAQPRNSEKANWKKAKKEAKRLKKEGWQKNGSLPLEDLLFKHYQKLMDENNQEVIGNVVGNVSVKTVNQGQQWAATNASILYAKSALQAVKGKINAEVGGAQGDGPSADAFYEGYESRVIKEIQGELKHSFGLYKEKKNGGIEYKAYYIINEENAHKARMRAMEMASVESEFARENARRISEFVNEPVNVVEE